MTTPNPNPSQPNTYTPPQFNSFIDLPDLHISSDSAYLLIAMVGLPASGKSFSSQRLENYTQWLGYDTKIFNLGLYRRHLFSDSASNAEFFNPSNEQASTAREEIAKLALQHIYQYFTSDQSSPSSTTTSNSQSASTTHQNSSNTTESHPENYPNTSSNPKTTNLNFPTTSTPPLPQSFPLNNIPPTPSKQQNTPKYGQIAILDATNTTLSRRQLIRTTVQNWGLNVKLMWIETSTDDSELQARNILQTKLFSPDYKGFKSPEDIVHDFNQRISHYRSNYTSVTKSELQHARDLMFSKEYDENNRAEHRMPALPFQTSLTSPSHHPSSHQFNECFIRILNAGKSFEQYNIKGYLPTRLYFFLLNIQLESFPIYLMNSDCVSHSLREIWQKHVERITKYGHCEYLCSNQTCISCSDAKMLMNPIDPLTMVSGSINDSAECGNKVTLAQSEQKNGSNTNDNVFNHHIHNNHENYNNNNNITPESSNPNNSTTIVFDLNTNHVKTSENVFVVKNNHINHEQNNPPHSLFNQNISLKNHETHNEPSNCSYTLLNHLIVDQTRTPNNHDNHTILNQLDPPTELLSTTKQFSTTNTTIDKKNSKNEKYEFQKNQNNFENCVDQNHNNTALSFQTQSKFSPHTVLTPYNYINDPQHEVIQTNNSNSNNNNSNNSSNNNNNSNTNNNNNSHPPQLPSTTFPPTHLHPQLTSQFSTQPLQYSALHNPISHPLPQSLSTFPFNHANSITPMVSILLNNPSSQPQSSTESTPSANQTILISSNQQNPSSKNKPNTTTPNTNSHIPHHPNTLIPTNQIDTPPINPINPPIQPPTTSLHPLSQSNPPHLPAPTSPTSLQHYNQLPTNHTSTQLSNTFSNPPPPTRSPCIFCNSNLFTSNNHFSNSTSQYFVVKTEETEHKFETNQITAEQRTILNHTSGFPLGYSDDGSPTAVGLQYQEAVVNYILKESSNWTRNLQIWFAPISSCQIIGKQVHDSLSNHNLQTKLVNYRSLRPLSKGLFAGYTEEIFALAHPQHYKEYVSNKLTFRFPRGESYNDHLDRLERLIIAISRTQSPLLLIAPFSSLRCIVGYFFNAPPAFIPYIVLPHNAIFKNQATAYNNIYNAYQVMLNRAQTPSTQRNLSQSGNINDNQYGRRGEKSNITIERAQKSNLLVDDEVDNDVLENVESNVMMKQQQHHERHQRPQTETADNINDNHHENNQTGGGGRIHHIQIQDVFELNQSHSNTNNKRLPIYAVIPNTPQLAAELVKRSGKGHINNSACHCWDEYRFPSSKSTQLEDIDTVPSSSTATSSSSSSSTSLQTTASYAEQEPFRIPNDAILFCSCHVSRYFDSGGVSNNNEKNSNKNSDDSGQTLDEKA